MTPRGFRVVKRLVIDERFKRARLEQVEDDPEYFHVWWNGKIEYGPDDEVSMRRVFKDLVLEKYDVHL